MIVYMAPEQEREGSALPELVSEGVASLILELGPEKVFDSVSGIMSGICAGKEPGMEANGSVLSYTRKEGY